MFFIKYFMANQKVIIGVVVAIIVMGGFFIFSGNSNSSNGVVDSQDSGVDVPNLNSVIPSDWINTELKDVNSQEVFKISDFSDKPVLLESFAVWCPTCTKQQKTTKKFEEEVGDSVISISIDTDPNEDEAILRAHTQANGFTWRYAIAPVEMTQALIDQFGVSIINAPSVPMVLICNGNAYELPSGVKSVEELNSFIRICS